MGKFFNINGSCFPGNHYMVDISDKLNQVKKLIEDGEYFTINRPRQYGKTTMLNELCKNLNDKYIVLSLSFEHIESNIYETEKTFNRRIAELFIEALRFSRPQKVEELKNLPTEDLSLYSFFSQFIELLKDPIVLFVDEADKGGNCQPFLNFLSILRAQYLERHRNCAFHSIALASVHDVKTLRPEREEDWRCSIPWNIAADFNVDMSFNTAEIKTMLASYAEDKGVKMDFDAIADRIFYHTEGHPYLTSYLCKIIDEELIDQKTNSLSEYWKLAYIDSASQLLISKSENIPHFAKLIEMLKEDQDLYRIVAEIIFRNYYLSYSYHNPILNKGIVHGLFRSHNGRTAINNPVYNKVLANFMSDYNVEPEASNEKV